MVPEKGNDNHGIDVNWFKVLEISTIPLSEEYTVSIDGDYVVYDGIINRINAMDNIFGSYDMQIKHQFICEGRSNSVMFHGEDVDPAVD